MASLDTEKAKRLWKTFDINVLVLVSLLIQMCLSVFAPNRKRSTSGLVSFSMWVLYLAADGIALYTIGLISNSLVGDQGPAHNADLLAFWSPFLLLHLGGPDTITALALEDNELWLRHALQLVSQVAVTVYVFIRCFRIGKTDLWLPTMLVFIDGLTKYTERVSSLYLASMNKFRQSQRTPPEPGPNYARLMEEYSSAVSAYIPSKIDGQNGPSEQQAELDATDHPEDQEDESATGGRSSKEEATSCWYSVKETEEMVQDAHRFYSMYKGLLADAFVSLNIRNESRAYFLKKVASDAFRIIEIELNLIYDGFYTKAFLLERKRGYLRLICFLSVLASLYLFSRKHKSHYDPFDVGVTFALLGGAIALDVISFLMFLPSDWLIIIASWDDKHTLGKSGNARGLLRHGWPKCVAYPYRSRWSESISEYSLLNRCLKDLPYQPPFFKQRLKDVLIGISCVTKTPIDMQVGNFIYKELLTKAKLATDVKEINEVCSARGNLIFEDEYLLISEYLRPWTIDMDYDESMLTWHLATDICYWTCDDNTQMYCRISKRISDYMSYLLLRKQAVVSSMVGIADIRFEDTCAEAKKFRYETLNSWSEETCGKAKKLLRSILMLQTSEQEENPHLREERILKQYCTKILAIKTDIEPIVAKGDKSKSVLFDACRLSKQLKMLGEQKQWEIMSKVWMELLCYAAIHSSARAHIAQLSKGGEFITLVWLLMAHLGLGERFRQNQGFGWTKLIIPK